MYSTNDWSYPSGLCSEGDVVMTLADPNGVDWNYPQGNAYTNTTANVAAYYGRLLSWLVKASDSDKHSL